MKFVALFWTNMQLKERHIALRVVFESQGTSWKIWKLEVWLELMKG